VLDLWDRHSGMPGLLNASSTASARDFGYVYDPESETYTNVATGRQVSDRQLRRAVFKVSNEASLRMKKTTQQLIAGVILLAAWYDAMRSLTAALYRTVFLLSIGGFLFEDDIARNVFYLLSLPQFERLDNFARQLETGVQRLNGRAMSRAGLYGSYGNALWQNIGLERAKKKRLTEAQRVLGPNENHCRDSGERPGCWELWKKGWMPIEEMVPIGEATCYSNCLCHIKYR
jgi:hypothetical protein